MTDPFRSPRRSLARAQGHIRNLEAEINAFIDTKPYAHVTEEEPDTGYVKHKIKLTSGLPEGLEDPAADAIGALRSALDQATYACAVAAGCADPKSAYFPVCKTEQEFENVIKGRCKDVPAAIIDAIRPLKPHDGGNNVLPALNHLCTINKHRLLTPVGVTSGAFNIRSRSSGIGEALIISGWDSTKNEIALYRSRADDLYPDIEITLHVVFGQVPYVGRLPAVDALDRMARETESALDAIEAAARSVGIF